MNYLLLSAGLLSISVGLVHSILGEILIFKNLRKNSLVPNVSLPPLREKNIRILWATWHLASIFGFSISAMLIHLAMSPSNSSYIIQAVAIAMCSSSVLVCYATKAKHPGWIGLLAVSVLCWLA